MQPTPENLARAKAFVLRKWQERHREYRRPEEELPTNLSNACKFAAVFARKVFGGKLQANWGHTWVEHPKVGLIDLTDNVDKSNYIHDPSFARNPDFREDLRVNQPRVNQWVQEFQREAEQPEKLARPLPPLPTRATFRGEPKPRYEPTAEDVQTRQKAAATGHKWDVDDRHVPTFAQHDPHVLAGLAGAEPGAHIAFTPMSNGRGFVLQSQHPQTGSGSLIRVMPQEKEMLIDHMRSGTKGQGKGAKTFLGMIQAARKFGIESMKMDQAAGKPGSHVYNGYYSWPRLGWNGSLENVGPLAKLPPHLRHATTFHELFDHPEGPEYWRDHGDEAYGLHFDPRPGSPHVQRLVKYLRSVQANRRGMKG